MSFEDHDGEVLKTKHDKALAEDGARLFDEDHQPGYGSGLRLDIKSFLEETSRGAEYLSRLDPVERFVLRAYYLLKKTEKQLADLVGLNECRFNMYLEGVTRKFTALVGVADYTLEDFDRVLVLAGVGWFECRGVHPTRGAGIASKDRKLVRTSSVLGSYQGTGSWLKTGDALGVYYVDLRKGVEAATEHLTQQPGIENELLAAYMLSMTKFSEVRDEGYSGRMGKLAGTNVRVKDATLMSPIDLSTLNSQNEDQLFTPRALNAMKQGY
jgi:hypothetical protein